MTDTIPQESRLPPATDSAGGARRPLTRQERAALQVRQYRRRRLIGWIALVAIIVIGGGGGYLLWGTSVLGLRTVTVSGSTGDLEPALADAVRAAMPAPDGTPLIRIDVDQIEARVDAIPGVAVSTVSRKWPGTLRVVVTPRQPAALVAANSKLYLIDSAGVPYVTVSEKPAGLISLRLATPGPGDPATLAGLAVIAAIPADLTAQVESVTARSAYDVSLALIDGRTVAWGSAADSARKAQILPVVLTLQGTEFDISDAEIVTVR